jgi:calcineurin-like phosphoesterase family protein
MDEHIIYQWNSHVQPHDYVYHLGDVAFGGIKSAQRIIPRLNGKKKLILGNHDYEAKLYYGYHNDANVWVKMFDEVLAYRQYGSKTFGKSLWMSHTPQAWEAFGYREGGDAINVHGHIHEKSMGDRRWCNVCVEKTGYKPVPIEDVIRGKFYA